MIAKSSTEGAGVMTAITDCVDAARSVCGAFFCCGITHDFIAAQQSAHCHAVTPRIFKLHAGPAARDVRASSATSNRATSANFLTRK